ncbi:MAG: lauroyl acyltransferase [Alphaproteobacteria bacterium]|nr:lauroyl acyltransferase [Alphaproteobacteria bacterium]
MAKRSPAQRRFYRAVGYPLEALGVAVVYGFFSLLPMDTASAVGAWIGRTLGPRLGYQKRATASLKRAFPDYSDGKIRTITRDMWDNLGRVLAELPHMGKIVDHRVTIVGEEYISDIREDGIPCIFFSGHFANWELFGLTARQVGFPLVQVYRAANNHFVDAMLRNIRKLEDEDLIPKGPKGARSAVMAIRKKRKLGFLVDQKMNDGIPVELFGRDAMTAPAIAELALRYDCPVIPVCMERLDGCNFQLNIYPHLERPAENDVPTMMRSVNKRYEEWITDRPGQWLCWLHRRWPED